MMRALVIEDAPDVRKILRLILESLRFDVLEAEDGRRGLDMLLALPDIRLALVDLYMPGINGLDLVRMIRSDKRLDGVRLMMVSTETRSTRVTEALKAGANEYLMKPFTKEMLLDKLKILGLL